jgi:hypothetical protein
MDQLAHQGRTIVRSQFGVIGHRPPQAVLEMPGPRRINAGVHFPGLVHSIVIDHPNTGRAAPGHPAGLAVSVSRVNRRHSPTAQTETAAS